MRHLVHLPTTDDPLEAWCALCADRNAPPQSAYCADCRPTYLEYQERLNRRPIRRIAHVLFGPHPAPATRFTPPASPGRPK